LDYSRSNFRWEDVLQYGVYQDQHASRIGYLHGIWRSQEGQTTVLLELRFFRGVHRDHFFTLVDRYFTQYTEVGVELREDLIGYRPYDEDGDQRHALWGNRNVHEEWALYDSGADGNTEVGAETPFVEVRYFVGSVH
jgi:hypothetical protein